MKKIAILGLFLASLSLNAMELSEKEKNIKVPVNFNEITLSNFIKKLMSLEIPRTVSSNLYKKLKDLEQASYNDLTSSIMPKLKEDFIVSLINLGVLNFDFYDQVRGIVKQEESDNQKVLSDIGEKISEIQAILLSCQDNWLTMSKQDINSNLDRVIRDIQNLEYLILENKDKNFINKNDVAALNLTLDDLRTEHARLETDAQGLDDRSATPISSYSDDEDLARRLQEKEYRN
ncbi:MAG: hypothetical protein ABIF12_00505 [bacterium]